MELTDREAGHASRGDGDVIEKDLAVKQPAERGGKGDGGSEEGRWNA